MKTEEVEAEIEKNAIAGIKKWMDDRGQERGNHYHVSSFTYECIRKMWYEEVNTERPEIDDEGYIRMWIGTKLHETPISDVHELPLMATLGGEKPFGGTVDEIMTIDGKSIIVDKKFTGKIPLAMSENYREQVLNYAALYKINYNKYIDGVALLYVVPHINYGNSRRMKAFVEWLTPNEINMQIKKIQMMIAVLEGHLKEKTLPEKHVTWYCKYCPYKVLCDGDYRDYKEANI